MTDLVETMSQFDIAYMIELKTELDMFGWLDNIWVVLGIIVGGWLLTIGIAFVLSIIDYYEEGIFFLIVIAVGITILFILVALDVHQMATEFETLCDAYRSIYGGLPWE